MPKKSLGQHFLMDQNVVGRVAAEVHRCGLPQIVEIGPGTGNLTRALTTPRTKLVLVELDTALAARLKLSFGSTASVEVVEQDARLMDAVTLPLEDDAPYTLAGNLPYNVATAILRNFMISTRPPRHVVCMLQLEVAQSLSAPLGKRGFAAVYFQNLADIQLLFKVDRGAFNPAPAVESAVVRMDPHPVPAVPPGDALFGFVHAVFRLPRKQLRNSLMAAKHMERPAADEVLRLAEVDGGLRPGNLSLEQWGRLHFAHARINSSGEAER